MVGWAVEQIIAALFCFSSEVKKQTDSMLNCHARTML